MTLDPNFDPSIWTPADFLTGGQQLLPRGVVWNRDLAALMTGLVGGSTDSTQAVHALAANLLQVESDPAQAVQLLPDFERIYGLPDPCTPLAPTLDQQRAALLAKIAATGGQSRAYYISVAAAYGYDVAITEYLLFRASISEAGDPVYNESQIFVWTINVPVAGPDAQFECIMQRIGPAHTELTFSYA